MVGSRRSETPEPGAATTSATVRAEFDGAPLERFAERLQHSFQRAADCVGLVRHDLEVGGLHVRLELAGRALEPVLLRALAHRTRDLDCGESADLTVQAWDSTSTGVDLPAPGVEPTDLRAGFLPELSDDRFHCALDPSSGAFSWSDRRAATAVWACPDARQARPYECAAPLRSILQVALQGHGLQLVHGAVVGTEQSGALILGRGGVGKSNTALACLGAGMRYLGDDYVVLDGSRKVAHNVFQTGKLFPTDLVAHPSLDAATHRSHNHAGKLVFFLAQTFTESLVSSLDVRVALIARVGADARTTIRPARPAEALLALAPNTLIQLPGTGGTELRSMAELLSGLPTFVIELGPDRSEVARTIARVIEEHAP